MPYTKKKTYVNDGSPYLSAANLNDSEQGIFDAFATADSAVAAAATASSAASAAQSSADAASSAAAAAQSTANAALAAGSAGSRPGVVQIDSFSGADDTTKLNAALSYAASQTNIPWLQLPYRTFNTGTSTFNEFSGMKILAAGVEFGSKNLELSSGKFVTAKWQTSCGNGASSLLQATSTVYDVAVIGVAFQCGSSSQIFRSTVNSYACDFEDLTMYGGYSLFGNPSEKFLATQVIFEGHWTAESFQNSVITMGGSDCSLDFYLNADASGAPTGGGKAIVILDSLQKTRIGFLYLTANNDWIGLQVKGGQDKDVLILGGVFEGRSASVLATRPVVDIQGGVVRMVGPHFGQVSDTSSGTVQGAVNQSGGVLTLLSPAWMRGNASASFPMLFQSGGTARVSDATSSNAGETPVIRWSSGSTVNVPAPANSIS